MIVPSLSGDELAVKIHVHVADPGSPISFGARFGSVTDVVVEDMAVQYEAYTASRDTVRSAPLLPAALWVQERTHGDQCCRGLHGRGPGERVLQSGSGGL